MRATAILETALYVTDIGAAEAFYRDVIGLPFISRVDGRHSFFRCGEVVLLLFKADVTKLPPSNRPSRCRRMGPWAKAMSAPRDGRRIEPVESASGKKCHRHRGGFPLAFRCRSIYVRDPSGNSVEFAKAKIWGLE